MIKWIKYDPDEGEVIEFCCKELENIYGKVLSYDVKEEKYCIRVPRYKLIEDHQAHRVYEEMVKPVQYDMVQASYCPFCGKHFYRDTTITCNYYYRDISGQMYPYPGFIEKALSGSIKEAIVGLGKIPSSGYNESTQV